MRQEMTMLCGFQCRSVQRVNAGMSSDEKYDVMLADGQRCMLRISPDSQAKRKKAEYSMLETAWKHGILVPRPYAFGKDAAGRIYQLSQWLEGRTLAEELAEFTGPERYEWGKQSGRLLKRIHEIPIESPSEGWRERFRRKIEIRMAEAEELMDVPEYGKRLGGYLLREIDVLDGCGQCFSHGDFYPGNLMHLKDGRLAVIDFNAYNGGYGEPVFETASVLLDRNIDEQYKVGFRAGYYGMKADRYTDQLLEYYQAYALLAELCETEDGNERNDILMRMHALAEKSL